MENNKILLGSKKEYILGIFFFITSTTFIIYFELYIILPFWLAFILFLFPKAGIQEISFLENELKIEIRRFLLKDKIYTFNFSSIKKVHIENYYDRFSESYFLVIKDTKRQKVKIGIPEKTISLLEIEFASHGIVVKRVSALD
jgi:hypothetical protein